MILRGLNIAVQSYFGKVTFFIQRRKFLLLWCSISSRGLKDLGPMSLWENFVSNYWNWILWILLKNAPLHTTHNQDSVSFIIRLSFNLNDTLWMPYIESTLLFWCVHSVRVIKHQNKGTMYFPFMKYLIPLFKR